MLRFRLVVIPTQCRLISHLSISCAEVHTTFAAMVSFVKSGLGLSRAGAYQGKPWSAGRCAAGVVTELVCPQVADHPQFKASQFISFLSPLVCLLLLFLYSFFPFLVSASLSLHLLSSVFFLSFACCSFCLFSLTLPLFFSLFSLSLSLSESHSFSFLRSHFRAPSPFEKSFKVLGVIFFNPAGNMQESSERTDAECQQSVVEGRKDPPEQSCAVENEVQKSGGTRLHCVLL